MIPATAHFIWFSRGFHWLHAIAIRSAAERGGFDRVVLHHDSPLHDRPAWDVLRELPGFESREIASDAIFAGCGELGDGCRTVYNELKAPAARANVLRAAILFAEGGVYLDTDTVTVADLTPLRRRGGVFVGVEHVAYPQHVLSRKRPLPMLGALARDAARDVARRLPDGWRSFRRIEQYYENAANNAVIGAEPGSTFVRHLLEGMVNTPPERRLVRYALGTHLLQRMVSEHAADPTLHIEPPAVFYPLGPEISEHWFRPTRHVALDEMLDPTTCVVHWYASVRTADRVPAIDASWVRNHHDRIPLAALLRDYAEEAR